MTNCLSVSNRGQTGLIYIQPNCLCLLVGLLGYGERRAGVSLVLTPVRIRITKRGRTGVSGCPIGMTRLG